MNPWYKDYSEYLSERFPGVKVQKLSIDAGFTCPNRDGTIGSGGCIYCNNRAFTPSYCKAGDDVATQLKKGRDFFARKYPEMKYLAYFQSFTGTHTDSTRHLMELYNEAASQTDVVGVIIGTRPDALPPDVLDILEDLNRTCSVIVEIGAETSHDRTLRLINRCHSWRQVEDAVHQLDERGIETGLHLISGLPGEDDEDLLATVKRTVQLPVSSLKLHQLQIIRGTELHRLWQEGKIAVNHYSVDQYLSLCVKVVEAVDRKVAIERFLASAPPDMVISPKWGLKNYEFTNLLLNRLRNKQINISNS